MTTPTPTPATPPAVRETVALSPTMCERLAGILSQTPAGDQALASWLDGRGLPGAYRLRITAATMEPVGTAPPAA